MEVTMLNKNIFKLVVYGLLGWMLVFGFIIAAKKRVIIAGGPAGGTFQVFANAVQVYDPIKDLKKYNVKAQASGGSTENLRLVNGNRVQMGVVHSGVIFNGRQGTLKGDKKKYRNVLAVGFLYGSPAQLIVKKGSGIKSVKDLKGKRVGVGNAGSGAFANCELFFSYMGIWDKIDRNAMGYNDAAQAFGNNQLDAFWLLTGFPSGAVILAAQNNDIEMVNLQKDAENSGYFKKYPYFTKVTIPAGIYKGVNSPSPTFEDSSIWVANKKVSKDLVYQMMKIMYADAGLEFMRKQKGTFKAMTVKNGTSGIITPLHPGAKKFWKEKGIL